MPELLQAARAALPTWVPWVPLAFAAVECFVVGLGAAWLGLAWALKIPPSDAPWHGRARLIFPGRMTLGLAVGVVLGSAGLLAFINDGPLNGASRGWVLGVSAVAGVLGTALGAGRLRRALENAAGTYGQRLRRMALVWLGIFPHLLVALGALVLLPPRPHGAAWAAPVAVGVALVLMQLGGGLWVLRALGILGPPSTALRSALDLAVERSGRPPRAAYEVSVFMANAFAFPTLGWLVVTTAAVESLDRNQLAALLSHELGHLSEAARTRRMRVLGGLGAVFPVAFTRVVYVTVGPWAALACVLAGLGIALAVRRLARKMEERADGEATVDPELGARYASALERLYEQNLVPAVMEKGRVHPHLYDRMLAAGTTPAYPRPEPPSRQDRLRGALGVVLWLPLLVLGGEFAPEQLNARFPLSHQAALWAVALRGGDVQTLERLGTLRLTAGDPRGTPLLHLMSALSTGVPIPLRTAMHFAEAHLCRDARQELGVALARVYEGRGVPRWIGEAELKVARCSKTSVAAAADAAR